MFLTSFIILIVSFHVCSCACVFSFSEGCVCALYPYNEALWQISHPEFFSWPISGRNQDVFSSEALGTKCKSFFFLCVKGYVFVCAYARGLTCLAQSHALWSEWLVFFFCRSRKCVYCSHAMKSSGSCVPDRGRWRPLHSVLTQAAQECWKNALIVTTWYQDVCKRTAWLSKLQWTACHVKQISLFGSLVECLTFSYFFSTIFDAPKA